MPCANRHMQMQWAVVPARRCAARRGQRPNLLIPHLMNTTIMRNIPSFSRQVRTAQRLR
jgi:hypothetical protein